jgi:hypothetical protein
MSTGGGCRIKYCRCARTAGWPFSISTPSIHSGLQSPVMASSRLTTPPLLMSTLRHWKGSIVIDGLFCLAPGAAPRLSSRLASCPPKMHVMGDASLASMRVVSATLLFLPTVCQTSAAPSPSPPSAAGASASAGASLGGSAPQLASASATEGGSSGARAPEARADARSSSCIWSSRKPSHSSASSCVPGAPPPSPPELNRKELRAASKERSGCTCSGRPQADGGLLEEEAAPSAEGAAAGAADEGISAKKRRKELTWAGGRGE